MIYVCKGIGAAWACWQATGAASVVCFGWGRVAAVASEIHKLRPAVQIVLVPDVVKEQEAIKIAKSISELVAALPNGWVENSDVNDLAQAEGLDLLKALLDGATEPPKPPACCRQRQIDHTYRFLLTRGSDLKLAKTLRFSASRLAIGFRHTWSNRRRRQHF